MSTPGSIDRRLYEADVEWLLCDAPGLLGERSVAASNFGAIERGGASPSISDTGPYHNQFIDAIDAVDRARKLSAAWEALPTHHQATLRARYITRQYWPLGCQAFLSQALVGVALYYAEDREALLDACTRGSQKDAKRVITAATKDAFERVRDAHNEWRRIRREQARKWVEQELGDLAAE